MAVFYWQRKLKSLQIYFITHEPTEACIELNLFA